MKIKKLLLLVGLISISVFSQKKEKSNEVFISREGINEVVNLIPNLNKIEIYNKAVEWVKLYYTSSSDGLTESGIRDEIIDKYIEGEKIIISKNNLILNRKRANRALFTDYLKMNYTLYLNFKDGKYKFTLIAKKIWSYNSTTGESSHSFNYLYTKKGKPNFMMKKSLIEANQTLNNINLSLLKYISKEKTKEGW
ncbi:MAG: DUF4468 domain-containing protein [Flavobacteriaceae bacterium]|nr:DUF4468 domain-containing protein [Flavobacteriaceae bacterium]